MTREQRKEAHRIAREKQREIDLAALDALEIQHGDEAVRELEIAYAPGLTTNVVVRCPSRSEIKRFQDRLRPRGDRVPDASAAAEELGAACIAYPTGEQLAAVLAARPAVLVTAGGAAAQLASGKSDAEGKG